MSTVRAATAARRAVVRGFNGALEAIQQTRDRMRMAATRITDTWVHGSEATQGGLHKAAGTFEGADRTPAEIYAELGSRTQQRVANNPKNTDPHWTVAAGDDVVLVGSVHNKTYKLRQSKALMRRLEDWIAATDGRDRIILVEGRVPELPKEVKSIAKAFQTQRGEGAGIAFRATKGKDRIDIASLEEDLGVQVRALSAQHPPRDVFAYYVLRHIPQGLAAQEKSGLDMTAHLDDAIDLYSHILPRGVDARQTFGEIMADSYSHTGFNGVFRKEDEAWLMRETNDPGVTGVAESPVQEVALACNLRRDAHAAEMIQEQVDAGKAVFAQFGIIHFDKVAPRVPAFDGILPTPLPAG